MRRGKGSRRIVVDKSEYRWRATGDDGYISIGIWPSNNIGSYIRGNLRYHETWVKEREGLWISGKDQIVITSRIIRRIIQYAISHLGYNPEVKGAKINLKVLDDVIQWDDAIRANNNPG